MNDRKAIFLDRDGTLNEDPGYISEPEKLHLLPGVGGALKRLHDAGFLLVIVSNQSGVGRGLIESGELLEVHARLDELLAKDAVKIDHYEICVHRPEEGCDCRKPKPALIYQAARTLQVDLKKSVMVGDKMSDLKAGRNAGLSRVALVRTGYGKETEAVLKKGEADFVGDSLSEVADWILATY